MKMTRFKKSLSFILCIMLIAAIALFAGGCNDNKTDGKTTTTPTTTTSASSEVTELGKGKTSFDFTVVDADGNETAFKIKTDKKFVGEALQELELISGEEGSYGLYVKTVNGKTLDFNKDGMYWAFYENGTYAQKGVDITEINADTVYSFKAEK